MKRTCLSFVICIFILFLVIVATVWAIKFGVLTVENINKSDTIKNEETALLIGKALLREYFPDMFLDKEPNIGIEENNGIWRVHNIVQKQSIDENGETWIQVGGEFYVEFRKSNGEVLKIGIND